MTPEQLQRLQALEETVQRLQQFTQQPVNLDTNLHGMLEVVSKPPSGIPKNLYDQVKIYVSGTTYQLYWYDWNAHIWHYVTATA